MRSNSFQIPLGSDRQAPQEHLALSPVFQEHSFALYRIELPTGRLPRMPHKQLHRRIPKKADSTNGDC